MKQITEDYCSYEVAKLLKEKGFDIPCRQAYFNGSLVDYTIYGFCDGELLDCPSQSLALKWLREVHKIHIAVNVGCDVDNENYVFYSPMIVKLNNKSVEYIESFGEDDEFDSNEKAVEAALLYVLKNLI